MEGNVSWWKSTSVWHRYCCIYAQTPANVGHDTAGEAPPTEKGRDMKFYRLILVTAFALLGTVTCFEAKPELEESEFSGKEQKEFKVAAISFQHPADDYTYARKEKFNDEMKTALNEMNTVLDDLSSKTERRRGAALAKARRETKLLRDKKEELSKQNDAAMAATEATWIASRDEMTDAYLKLMNSLSEFR